MFYVFFGFRIVCIEDCYPPEINNVFFNTFKHIWKGLWIGFICPSVSQCSKSRKYNKIAINLLLILEIDTACLVLKMKSIAIAVHLQRYSKNSVMLLHVGEIISNAYFYWTYAILNFLKWIYITEVYYKVHMECGEYRIYCSFTRTHKRIFLQKEMNDKWATDV